MKDCNYIRQNLQVLAYEDEFTGYGRSGIYFGIPSGCEAEAVCELLDYLEDGADVILNYEYDEEIDDHCVSFKQTSEGLSMQEAGHHWSSNWKPIDESEFENMVMKLAPHNRGGLSGERGILAWNVSIESQDTPNKSMDVRAKQRPFWLARLVKSWRAW
jgi:hypothetical protein